MDMRHCRLMIMLLITAIDDENQLVIGLILTKTRPLIRSTLPLIIEHPLGAEAKAVYLPAAATDVCRALREEDLPIPSEVEAAVVEINNYCRVCPLMLVVVIKKTDHAAKAEAHHTEEAEAHHTEESGAVAINSSILPR